VDHHGARPADRRDVYTIRSKYLIGADGARSKVAEDIGAAARGPDGHRRVDEHHLQGRYRPLRAGLAPSRPVLGHPAGLERRRHRRRPGPDDPPVERVADRLGLRHHPAAAGRRRGEGRDEIVRNLARRCPTSRWRSPAPPCGATTRCTRPTCRSSGSSARATRSTGTRRRTASAPTPRSRTPTTWPGSSRRCCAARRARSCWRRTRRARPGRPADRHAGQQVEPRVRPVLRGARAHRRRDRGGDAGADRGAQGQHAARRGQAGGPGRGDGAEELRVQRARRRARPVLRVDRRPGRREHPARPAARPRAVLPGVHRARLAPAARLGRRHAGRAQGLHPGPRPVRRVHADHRHRRRAVGGGRREGAATTWAFRSRRSSSARAARSPTSTTTGRGSARSTRTASCWCGRTSSSAGAR
jgi:hypothetical protein